MLEVAEGRVSCIEPTLHEVTSTVQKKKELDTQHSSIKRCSVLLV